MGDLTERKQLRERLQCKSFQWFLDEYYPEKFIPDKNVYAYGMVSDMHWNKRNNDDDFSYLPQPLVFHLLQ